MSRLRVLQDGARAAGNPTRQKELGDLIGAGGGFFAGGGGGPSLARVSGNLTQLMGVLEDADRAPTTSARMAAEASLRDLESLLAKAKGLEGR